MSCMSFTAAFCLLFFEFISFLCSLLSHMPSYAIIMVYVHICLYVCFMICCYYDVSLVSLRI
jgi:hypothetical protein